MFLFSKAITLHVVLLPQWMGEFHGALLKLKSARPVTTTEKGVSLLQGRGSHR